MRRLTVLRIALGAGLLAVGGAAPVHASRESDALRLKASDQLYNLDRDQAMGTFRQAVAADGQDASAFRGLATCLWLSITFRRGNMTVDDYLGRVTRPNPTMAAPPPDTAAAYRDAIEH